MQTRKLTRTIGADRNEVEPEKNRVVKDAFKENLAERAEKELRDKVARYEELNKKKIEHEQKLERLKENERGKERDHRRLSHNHFSERSRICSTISAKRGQIEKLETNIEQLMKEKSDAEASFRRAQEDFQKEIQLNKKRIVAEEEMLQKIDLETKILMTSEKNRLEIDWMQQVMKKLEEKLNCPVCLETAKRPIYKCDEDHLVCGKCRVRLSKCPECRERYRGEPKRHRWAEKDSEELQQMEKRVKVLAGVDEVQDGAPPDV